MITGFDIVIFLGILLAMLFSKWPKQFAIAVCAIVQLLLIEANYFIPGAPWYPFAYAVEGTALVALLLYSFTFTEANDRRFFRLMAYMLLGSIIVTWTYTLNVTPYWVYFQMSHAVAMLHVALMLGAADGIRDLLQHYRRGFHRLHAYLDL